MRNSNLWMGLNGLIGPRGMCFADGDAAGGGGGAGAAPATPAAAPAGGGKEGAGAPPAAAPVREASLESQRESFTLTDDKGKPERALGEQPDAFLERYREWKGKQPVEGAAEETPEAKAAREKAAKDAAAGAETPEQKTAREKAAKDAAAAETPEAKAAREKAEKDAAAALVPEEDLSPVPTEKLAEVFKKNPALQEQMQRALEAEGLSTDALFAAARLAHQASAYKTEFPTLESAQYAKAQATAFQSMDEHFTAIEPRNLESTASFINEVMMPLTYMRDQDTGEVLVDQASGLPRTDGAVFTFLDNIVDLRTDYLGKELDRLTAEDGAEAALQFIAGRPEFARLLDKVIEVAGKAKDKDAGEQIKLAAEVLKERGKGGTSSAAEGEHRQLNPQEKAELEQARIDRQKAADDSKAATKQRIDNFQDEVLTESSRETDKSISAFLDATSLKDDKLRPQIEKEVRDALYKALSDDPLYRGQRDRITINGLTKKTHEQWVALNKRETAAKLTGIVEPIIAKYGGRRLTQRQARQATQDAQAKATQQHEVQGGAGGAHLPGAATPKTNTELSAEARENLRAKGEDINSESLLKEFRRLKNAQAALVA